MSEANTNNMSDSKKSLKHLLKKKDGRNVTGDTAVIAGSPEKSSGVKPRKMGKKESSTQLTTASSTSSSKGGGGKGIESIQKLVSKNKRRFVGTNFWFFGFFFLFFLFPFFFFFEKKEPNLDFTENSTRQTARV
jgi:hypothetical protein